MPLPSSCITQRADFQNVYLCRGVLAVALYSNLYHYESAEVPDDENRYIAVLLLPAFYLHIITLFRKFKRLAYKQLAWWKWQHLGRHRYVVLPSYAMGKIRDEFPLPAGEYTGHQYLPSSS